MIDGTSNKILKGFSVIGVFTILTAVITFIARFLLPVGWIDDHFLYFSLSMAALCGLVTGHLIKDTLPGKITYGILSAFFGAWIITLSVTLVMFLGFV